MRAVFGINASDQDRKLMTKLPAKLFNDFEPGGGLCIILQAALKYRLDMVCAAKLLLDRILMKAIRKRKNQGEQIIPGSYRAQNSKMILH